MTRKILIGIALLYSIFLAVSAQAASNDQPTGEGQAGETVNSPQPSEPPPVWNYPPETETNKPEAQGEKPGKDPKDWGTEYWHGTVRANWWNADYGAKIKAIEEEHGQLIGTTVDVRDDLDLKTPTSAFEMEFWSRPSNRNRFILSYFWSSYSGDVDDLGQKIDIAGKTFQATYDVETEITIQRFQSLYQFLPLANERGGIGPLIGLECYVYQLRIESKDLDEKMDQTLPLPIPVIGLAGDYTIGYGLGVWGKFAWIGADIAKYDVKANYTDWELGASFKYKRLYAGVSYRSLVYDLEVGNEDKDGYIKLDADQSGILASLGVNF